MRTAGSKILTRSDARAACERWRAEGKCVVFTNGAFDILHAGHVTYLEYARSLGDVLIVGLNSDESIRRYKGATRPIVEEANRCRMMAALECVDAVTVFEEDEPKDLIAELLPNVLVKAADWAHYVSGREVVEQHGGRVVLAEMVQGVSTSALIQKIIRVYKDDPEGKPAHSNQEYKK